MPIALRIFLQILAVLVTSFIVTTSVGFLNKPSDMAVLFGVFGLLVAVYLLWYATKYIWRNFFLTTKGGK